MPIDLPEGVYSGYSIYGEDVMVPGVSSLGEHWSSPRLKPVSKKLENFTLLLQLEGECSFRINGKDETLSNGNMMLLARGVVMERLDQKFAYNHCIWIGFSMRRALQDMPDLLETWKDFTYLNCRFLPKHQSLLKTIVNEHASPGPFSEEIAKTTFQAFVYSLQEATNDTVVESPVSPELTQNPTVLHAIDLFEREYSNHWDLRTLSDRLAVSESKLTKAFRQATGESPMASLWKIRLIKGYELLVSSSMNITQIALMVGFQSSQSFATAFKRSFKATPREVKTGAVAHVEPREFFQNQDLGSAA
ncbi:MAG: helix-turn-helix transcriptional regulator [Opitutales bacterium]